LLSLYILSSYFHTKKKNNNSLQKCHHNNQLRHIITTHGVYLLFHRRQALTLISFHQMKSEYLSSSFQRYCYIWLETNDFSSIMRRHISYPIHDGILMHRKVSSCNGNLERYTMFTMKTLLRFYFFHTTHAYHSSRRNNIFRSLLRW
jgi:hypothetical protein